MSFNKHYSFCEIFSRPRPCCNLQCGSIITEMKISYKFNQISAEQAIIPTRFELYDDSHIRCVWNLRFLIPVKLGLIPLLDYLKQFALYALATDTILVQIGVKTVSEITKELTLLPSEREKLGCEFNELGIAVLDDETLLVPPGMYENSPNVQLDWGILHLFYWTNWELSKAKLKADRQISKSSSSSDESTIEAVDGTKRGYDTCGNFSFH